ncbi:MAG TPA: hypothetical protein VKB05_21390 [Pyrinomonadaceae bacterium]|nr:hypothetical protein [Pyrinomonadaceae bacterium]
MDFTSINKLTALRRDVTTIIKPEFNDWIGRRWRSGTGLFKAALLSFQQPAEPFGQMSWPQPRQLKSQFLFAPSIQLTFNSGPISNMFSESHTRNLQASHQSISRPVFDVRNFMKRSHAGNTFNFQSSFFSAPARVFPARQYWSTLFAVKNQRHSPGSHVEKTTLRTTATALHTTQKLFEQLAGMLSTHSVTRHSATTERPTLITISNSVRHWTQFLSNLFQRSTEHRYAEKSDHVRSFTNQASLSLERIFTNDNSHRESRQLVREKLLSVRDGINRNIFQSFMEAALSFRSWVNIRTVDEATHSRQTFLKQLNSQFLLKQSLQERSFASVVQKFAVSKSSSSAETVARQVQYFGPPPDLTYAKNESPQFQQLVTALRDFRPAQNEIKAPAPQLPSIAQLTNQVRQELERELRIERERRGL